MAVHSWDETDISNRPHNRLDSEWGKLREHREGKHSGRRWDENCPHCQEFQGLRAPLRVDRMTLSSEGPDGTSNPLTAMGTPNQWPTDDDEAEGRIKEEIARRWVGFLPNFTGYNPFLRPELSFLRAWWTSTSRDDLDRAAAKAIEYGSYDMEMIGGTIADLLGWDSRGDGAAPLSVTRAELGTWFYLLGKLARGISALKDYQPPSDDTLRDIETYARMIRRIRDCGEWPGPIEEEG